MLYSLLLRGNWSAMEMVRFATELAGRKVAQEAFDGLAAETS
jgi:hypothetical protein